MPILRGRSARMLALIGLCVCAALAAPTVAMSAVVFGVQREVLTLTPGGTALDLSNADFNGDGRQDVLVLRGRWGSRSGYPISILVNDGAGGFRDEAPLRFAGPVPRAIWPRQALIADFNGDGRPDIFVGDTGIDQPPFPGARNHLALSAPGGRYVDASANLPPEVAYFHSGATGDVDGDGDIDIFLADLGTPIRLLLNDGGGRFTTAVGRFPESVLRFGHERYTRSAMLDVNGDTTLDLVLLAEEHNASSTLLVNDGSGRFAEVQNAIPPKPFGADAIGIAIQAVQLNGDAHPDLLLGYTKGNPWYVGRWIQTIVNNGDGSFRDETATRLPQADNAFDWPYDLVLADLDSDGSVEFGVDVGSSFCCASRRAVAPVYRNRGDGTFAPLPDAAFAEPPYGQLRLIDVNDDGLLDVFGVFQAGPADAPERYVVQLQGEGAPLPPPRADNNIAGVPKTGPPPAILRWSGTMRATQATKRRVRLHAGIRAHCPPAGFVCRGRMIIQLSERTRRRPRTLGSVALAVPSGATSSIAVLLSARAASRLRAEGKLKISLAVSLRGPDGNTAALRRTATIRPPKR